MKKETTKQRILTEAVKLFSKEGYAAVSVDQIAKAVGIKATIADYGVDEKYFLETLDDMTEQAFNDQCTGANPRYPLISELKEIYLMAYYGKEYDL